MNSPQQKGPYRGLLVPKQNTEARLRVFIFPAAATAAKDYVHFANNLGDSIEVCILEYPGRGSRQKNPLLNSMEAIVEDIEGFVLPFCNKIDRQTVFIGHSLGTAIMYELAKRLKEKYLITIAALIPFGRYRGPPHIEDPDPTVDGLSNQEISEQLTDMADPENAELFSTPQYISTLLPIFKADSGIAKKLSKLVALPIKIIVYGGTKEDRVDESFLRRWKECTTLKDQFVVRMFPGNHFFHTTKQCWRGVEVALKQDLLKILEKKDAFFKMESKTCFEHEPKPNDPRYLVKEVATVGNPDWRMYIYRDIPSAEARLLSPFHDIPMWSYRQKGYVNMVVEIAKGTKAKLEINKSEYMNPIKQDVKNGKLRYVAWDYPFTYGAVPQTWENPETISDLPGTGRSRGDNDPLDIIDISEIESKTGEVKEVKVLGCYAMVDEGETDWKILAIDVRDKHVNDINDAVDISKYYPGKTQQIFEFLRDYKIPDGKPQGKFAFNSELLGKQHAIRALELMHNEWKNLITRGHQSISTAHTVLGWTGKTTKIVDAVKTVNDKIFQLTGEKPGLPKPASSASTVPSVQQNGQHSKPTPDSATTMNGSSPSSAPPATPSAPAATSQPATAAQMPVVTSTTTSQPATNGGYPVKPASSPAPQSPSVQSTVSIQPASSGGYPVNTAASPAPQPSTSVSSQPTTPQPATTGYPVKSPAPTTPNTPVTATTGVGYPVKSATTPVATTTAQPSTGYPVKPASTQPASTPQSPSPSTPTGYPVKSATASSPAPVTPLKSTQTSSAESPAPSGYPVKAASSPQPTTPQATTTGGYPVKTTSAPSTPTTNAASSGYPVTTTATATAPSSPAASGYPVKAASSPAPTPVTSTAASSPASSGYPVKTTTTAAPSTSGYPVKAASSPATSTPVTSNGPASPAPSGYPVKTTTTAPPSSPVTSGYPVKAASSPSTSTPVTSNGPSLSGGYPVKATTSAATPTTNPVTATYPVTANSYPGRSSGMPATASGMAASAAATPAAYPVSPQKIPTNYPVRTQQPASSPAPSVVSPKEEVKVTSGSIPAFYQMIAQKMSQPPQQPQQQVASKSVQDIPRVQLARVVITQDYAFPATDTRPHLLSVSKGDIFKVFMQDTKSVGGKGGEWWGQREKDGKEGLFPSVFTSDM